VTILVDTPTNLVVGAGDVLVDHANIGATSGDNVFRIERTIFTPELNGTKGALIGTDYVQKSEGVMEVGIPEFNATLLARGWPASRSTPTPGMTVIDETDVRRVPSTDYHDWELQVARLNGGEFQFEADKAINTANIEATLGDAALAAPRFELHSRWNPADLTKSPHRIRILDVAS